MEYPSFDLMAFAKSLVLPTEHFRSARVESSPLAASIRVIADPVLLPEVETTFGVNDSRSLEIWVTWMQDEGILRMEMYVDLELDPGDEEQHEVLVKGVNHLNTIAIDRVSRIFVRQSSATGAVIGGASHSILVPPCTMADENALTVLRVITISNMVRLCHEISMAAVELRQAAFAAKELLSDELPGEEPDKVKELPQLN